MSVFYWRTGRIKAILILKEKALLPTSLIKTGKRVVGMKTKNRDD